MQPQEFCYWLQGFAELNGSKPTAQQWEMIKEHLNLVFNKVTVLENKKSAFDLDKTFKFPSPVTPVTGEIIRGALFTGSSTVFYTC